MICVRGKTTSTQKEETEDKDQHHHVICIMKGMSATQQ